MLNSGKELLDFERRPIVWVLFPKGCHKLYKIEHHRLQECRSLSKSETSIYIYNPLEFNFPEGIDSTLPVRRPYCSWNRALLKYC